MRKELIFLMIFALALGAPGCRGGGDLDEDAERRYLARAMELVTLAGNYTPENAEASFGRAKALLIDPARHRYGDGILGAELSAVRALNRTQQFAVRQEEASIVELEDGSIEVVLPGLRTRTVGDQPPERQLLQYRLLLLPPEEGAPALTPPKIAQVSIEYLRQGESGELVAMPGGGELLEKLKEASAAAKDERSNFLQAVDAVRSDLESHEQKVEQSFERLATSLDKLGSKVREMGEAAKKLPGRRVETGPKVIPASDAAAPPAASAAAGSAPSNEPIEETASAGAAAQLAPQTGAPQPAAPAKRQRPAIPAARADGKAPKEPAPSFFE